MLIFDDGVVRSADEIFYLMSSNADCCSTEAISQELPNIKYCVNRDEMVQLQQNTATIIKKSQDRIDKLKTLKSSRILIKIAFVIVFTMVPVVMRLIGLLTQDTFSFAQTAAVIISILYFFLG
jgi:hypothetical protein